MAADFRPARSTATAWRTYAPGASGRARTRPLNRSRLSPRRPRALKRPPMDGARFPDALGAKRSLSGFGAKSSGAPPPRTTSNRTSAARDRRKRSPVPARPRCTIAGPRFAGVKVAGASSKPVSSGGVLFGGSARDRLRRWARRRRLRTRARRRLFGATAPAAARRDLDVVDPDPLVLSDSVRREHAHLNEQAGRRPPPADSRSAARPAWLRWGRSSRRPRSRPAPRRTAPTSPRGTAAPRARRRRAPLHRCRAAACARSHQLARSCRGTGPDEVRSPWRIPGSPPQGRPARTPPPRRPARRRAGR